MFLTTYVTIVQCDVVLCCIIFVLEIVVILILIQSYVIVRYGYVAVYGEVPHLLTNILYNSFLTTKSHPY